MNEFDPQALQIILEESLAEIRSGQETLDSILDKYPDIAEELRPGLEAALWLDTQRPSLDPRPGFITASRARLVAEINKNNPGGIAARRSSFLAPLAQLFQPKYALQLALVFILLIGFIATGTVFVAAANNSIPGDPLYRVKLNFEQTRLILTPTEIGRARLNIEFAHNRSQELQQLALEDRYEYVPPTIVRFDLHVTAAIDSLDKAADRRPEAAEDLAIVLQEVVEEQVVLLSIMAESAPPEARVSLLGAIQVTQTHSISINELLQKLIGPPPASSTTLPAQVSDTPLPTLTSTRLVPATGSPTPTPTPSLTPLSTDVRLSPSPTPTRTPEDQTEPGIPTDTPTLEPINPTDTPVPVVPTDTPLPVIPTDTPSTPYPDPTEIPPPTSSVEPPPPTPIPPPTTSVEPPPPTSIPGFGGEDPPTETPRPTHTPKPTKTPRP